MAKGFQRQKGQSQRHPPLEPFPASGRQRTLCLRNRQRVRPVDLRVLRQIAQALLRETWPDGNFDLAIYLVAEPEMIRLNEGFLHHKGSTDVITFDYSENVGQPSRRPNSPTTDRRPQDTRESRPVLRHGEIFVCVDEASSQARRFHTSWQSELVRYIVHGVLHLLGYDDPDKRARHRMKEEENSLLGHLASLFDLQRLDATRSKKWVLA